MFHEKTQETHRMFSSSQTSQICLLEPQPLPSMLRSLSKLPLTRPWAPQARHLAVLRHDWTRAEAGGIIVAGKLDVQAKNSGENSENLELFIVRCRHLFES